MKPTAIGALSLLFLGVFGWFLLNQEPSSSSHGANVAAAKRASDSTITEPAAVALAPDAESEDVINLRKRVQNLKAELETIIAERRSAEAALQQAERDVTALEQFIEEIKTRGEDPADYADEGLVMFQPAFAAYQNAFDKMALTEAMEQATTEEIAAAEEKLANRLFDSDIGK